MLMIAMNRELFEKSVQGGNAVLVEFQAPWCGYCRRIQPAMDKIAAEYADRLTIGTVNIDDEPALADREQIELVPTLVLYRAGKAVASIVAPDSKAKIDGFIRENLR